MASVLLQLGPLHSAYSTSGPALMSQPALPAILQQNPDCHRAGLWASAIADKYPGASVVVTNLPRSVQTQVQLSNVRFEVQDCWSQWAYPQNHFDFIHIRGLRGFIADWPALYRHAYLHLRPGAWLEQLEWSIHLRSADGTLTTDRILRHWSQNSIRVGMLIGKTSEIAENMAGLLREAGFENVVETRSKWPVGAWSSDSRLREIGTWNLQRWREGMGHGSAMLDEVIAALRNPGVRVYQEVRVVYGRKAR